MNHSIALALLLPMPTAEAESLSALYAIEDIASKLDVSRPRNLVRLSFDEDNKLAKKTILSKNHRYFSHFGGNRLALGQFVVTENGGVIDLQAGKVIYDLQDGTLLGLEDGKIVYRMTNTRLSSGLFSFDLTTGKVGKIELPSHWELPGEKSPDKTMSVKQVDVGGMLRLYRLGKTPIDLGAHLGFTYKKTASPSGEGVPCLWLNAERILTIQTNSKLVTLSTQGVLEQLVEIQDAPAAVSSRPRLWIDKVGQIIYSCGGKDFLIDVRAKAASPLKHYSLGHGFEASVAVDEEQRRSVYQAGKLIGRWAFYQEEAATAPGLIAIPYAQPAVDAQLGYSIGIAVWSSRVGDWQTSMMSVNSVIGWSK